MISFKINPLIYLYRWEIAIGAFFLAQVCFMLGTDGTMERMDEQLRKGRHEMYCKDHPLYFACKK